MSNKIVRNIRTLAEATLVETTWAQWSVLTTTALPAAERRAWTIVDPEALILASLSVGHHERRLNDLVGGWTRVGASLMSMQRMRTLAKHFPDRVQDQLGPITAAAKSGGHLKWERLTAESQAPEYRLRDKPVSLSRLTDAPALTLRLRAGIGVNAKADLLSLLLGLGGEAADLKVIAAATAYTERAIRIAVQEMTLAGFIHEIEGRPSSYYAEPRAWAQLLQHQLDRSQAEFSLPRWRFWWAVFAFLAKVADWGERAEASNWTDYVASSRARDLLGHHERRLRQAQVAHWGATSSTGEGYLLEFEEFVKRLQSWATDSLYGH